MFEKGSKKGTVRFSIRPGGVARKVEIAGDFTQWQPRAMRKNKDGSFVALVPLSPGTYEYKFVLDGEWVTDPDNATSALNEMGSVNSVAELS